jgi:hypothetical protein
MELLFNELSIIPLSENQHIANEKMKVFSEAVALARKNGFRNIRSHYAAYQIELSENYNLHDWLNNKGVSEIYRNNLYGMIIQPFINEDDEEIETEYLGSEYLFEDESSGITKTECLGLASAYLYETPAISFASLSVWENKILQIIILSGEVLSTGDVLNVSKKESFVENVITTFIENQAEIVLKESSIEPDSKKYHFSAHHGVNELTNFWKKLKSSPYVIESRSTDWGGKKFIRKIDKTGVLEIVLTDSDRQYALWVQTTGKNYRETRAIAEILKEEFS